MEGSIDPRKGDIRMKRTVRVGGTAFAPSAALGSGNLAQMLADIDRVAAMGLDLVVFPEVCLQGYRGGLDPRTRRETLAWLHRTAEPVPDGPAVQQIAARARSHGIHVVYGLTELDASGASLHNTAVLTGPDGHIGSYRKVHLGPGERYAWNAGDRWPVFETEIGRIGLMICYDKVWPEAARELALGGAQLVAAPAAWPVSWSGDVKVSPDLIWDLEGVRALENSVWVVTANYAGEIGGTRYDGRVKIFSPDGTVVAETGSTDEWSLAHADVDLQGGIWASHAAWLGERLSRDRRPETYRRSAAAARD